MRLKLINIVIFAQVFQDLPIVLLTASEMNQLAIHLPGISRKTRTQTKNQKQQQKRKAPSKDRVARFRERICNDPAKFKEMKAKKAAEKKRYKEKTRRI